MSKPIPSASVQDAFALSKSEIASVAEGLYRGHPEASATATRVSFRQGKAEKDVITLTVRSKETQVAWASLTHQAGAVGKAPKMKVEMFSAHGGERGDQALRVMERALRDFAAAATAHLAHKRELLTAMKAVVKMRLGEASPADMDASAAQAVLGLMPVHHPRAFQEAFKITGMGETHAGFTLETRDVTDGIALILNAEGGAASYVRIPYGRTPTPSVHVNADLGLTPENAERLERLTQAAFTQIAAKVVSKMSQARPQQDYAPGM